MTTSRSQCCRPGEPMVVGGGASSAMHDGRDTVRLEELSCEERFVLYPRSRAVGLAGDGRLRVARPGASVRRSGAADAAGLVHHQPGRERPGHFLIVPACMQGHAVRR